MCRLQLTVLTIVVGSLCGCTDTAVAQGCVQIDWTAPATIGTPTAFGGYVEVPEILESKDGIFFMGSPSLTLEHDLTKSRPVAGFLRSSSGTFTVIPVPAGHNRMMAPHATIAPDGTLHLLWVPPDSATGWQDRSEKSQVFASRFVRGAWSTPITVFRNGKTLSWDFTGMAVVSRGAERELIARLLAEREIILPSRPRGSVARFQLVDTVWRTTTLRGPWNFSPRLVLPEKGGLVVGFIDGVSDDRRMAHGLFATRSIDGGASWSSPVQISRPESESSFDPLFFESAAGRLIAVWSVGIPDGTRTAIAASVSPDTGHTWTAPSVTTVRGELTSMRAAVSKDGSAFAIVQNLVGEAQRPVIYAWDGRWTHVWSLPEGEAESFSQPTIAVLDRRIVATWQTTAPAPGAPGKRVAITRFVIGRPRC